VGYSPPLTASDLFDCPKLQTGTITTTRIIIMTTGRVAVIRPVKLLSIARTFSLGGKIWKCKGEIGLKIFIDGW
jgi:hypothetical protein